MVKIAPSILAADVLNLERDVRKVMDGGCDWLHVDIMDAHFVSNLSYSPAVVSRLKETFPIPLDVHLMMSEPEKYLDAFLQAGADILTIHAEAPGFLRTSDKAAALTGEDRQKLANMLRRIRSAGAKAGLALRPDTGIEPVIPLLKETDLVLTMTVEPGYGGQKLQRRVIHKIRELRELGYRGEIEADGGLTADNLMELVCSGLSVAVMGTAVFAQTDAAAVIRKLHETGGEADKNGK